MKKMLLPFALILLLLMSACGGNNENNGSNSSPAPSDSAAPTTGTITYESQSGPVEVPANPQRVVVLSSFAGNVMALGVNVVGVDAWSKQNPKWTDRLKDAVEVTDEDLEKIIELDPDLIIGLDNVKNVDKLKEIAPTVVYTYGKVDYLTQQIEIGKLLNKEKEATDWVNDFKARAEKAGNDIKAKIGAESTISVLESFDKQIYVYGDNWGRGTEILYQAMKLEMPQKVKDTALKDGYYAVSTEVISEFMGDYVIFSNYPGSDVSFKDTDTYKNIPAVKNGQVYEVNAQEFYFNDPLTLDLQLAFFTEKLLGE